MADKIQVGENVIGSTGFGRYGKRQYIGEFMGRLDEGEYIIKEKNTGVRRIVWIIRRLNRKE